MTDIALLIHIEAQQSFSFRRIHPEFPRGREISVPVQRKSPLSAREAGSGESGVSLCRKRLGKAAESAVTVRPMPGWTCSFMMCD
jgi:hypothetical protein